MQAGPFTPTLSIEFPYHGVYIKNRGKRCFPTLMFKVSVQENAISQH